MLQALANDGLAPRFLGRTSETGQPTVATWATGGIALAAVALGDLNAVGCWVTVFFLTLYVTINAAATIEKLVGDPSYRPTINVPWPISLMGSLSAIVIMFLINPLACAVAVTAEMAIYAVLRRRALQGSWGDVRAGLWTAVARLALLNLKALRVDQTRNWRPHILLFTANPASRIALVKMANWFNQNRGITTVCQAVQGDLDTDDLDLDGRLAEMDETLEKEGLVAFSEVHAMPKFEDALVGIAQANGYAGLQSNTVMFGWPGGVEGLKTVARMVRILSKIKRNTIIARIVDDQAPRERRRIDVWWRGQQFNGDLMLLLAHLLRLNHEWRQATIHIRAIVPDATMVGTLSERIDEMLRETRIQAEPAVLVQPPDRSPVDVIHETSRDADAVFLGLGECAVGDEAEYAERLTELVEGLPTTILVRSAGPFAGKLL